MRDGGTETPPRKWSDESADRFARALADIAFSDEANEWARKRAAEGLYIITDPAPPEAIALGRELAEKYGW